MYIWTGKNVEVVVAYFKIPWQHMRGETYENNENYQRKDTTKCNKWWNFKNKRTVYKVRGLTLLLRVGTMWRCGDRLFFEADDLMGTAIIPIRTSAIRSRARTVRFLAFSKHIKRSKPPAPLSSWSLRQTVCSTISRSGWSVIRSASLAKGRTSKNGPSQHLHKVQTRSNKVSPRTLQTDLVSKSKYRVTQYAEALLWGNIIKLCSCPIKIGLTLTEHYVMKAYEGSGSITPRVLELGTRWRSVVNFTHRPLYSQGKSPWYPLDRRLDGPHSRSGHGGEEKNS
jgi:hypothetical protein